METFGRAISFPLEFSDQEPLRRTAPTFFCQFFCHVPCTCDIWLWMIPRWRCGFREAFANLTESVYSRRVDGSGSQIWQDLDPSGVSRVGTRHIYRVVDRWDRSSSGHRPYKYNKQLIKPFACSRLPAGKTFAAIENTLVRDAIFSYQFFLFLSFFF